jgi:TolA-binding protein
MSANERRGWLRLKRLAELRLSPRARQAVQSLALGLSVASVVVAAVELSRWHPHGERRTKTSAPAPSAFASAKPNLQHDLRLVPVPHESASSEAPRNGPLPTMLGLDAASAPSGSSAPSASTVTSAAAPGKYKSAADLFADANQARVRGDTHAAIAISQLLEATFPNSTEGITTHLSLGVLYLQTGEPNLALQEFKIYRHIGASEMMAEALWGEEQAYQKLGQPGEERAVLEELLQNYPRSAYAAAAEQRLAALNN